MIDWKRREEEGGVNFSCQISVDGKEVNGWDVKNIVSLIIGPQVIPGTRTD